jgi:hypothetical protein
VTYVKHLLLASSSGICCMVSEHSVGFQIKIGRPKFYAGEMITPEQ